MRRDLCVAHNHVWFVFHCVVSVCVCLFVRLLAIIVFHFSFTRFCCHFLYSRRSSGVRFLCLTLAFRFFFSSVEFVLLSFICIGCLVHRLCVALTITNLDFLFPTFCLCRLVTGRTNERPQRFCFLCFLGLLSFPESLYRVLSVCVVLLYSLFLCVGLCLVWRHLMGCVFLLFIWFEL